MKPRVIALVAVVSVVLLAATQIFFFERKLPGSEYSSGETWNTHEIRLPLFGLDYDPLGPEFTFQPWWEQFDSNRTLYVAPYTGMANSIQSIGSALTISYRHRINVKFVFHHPYMGPAKWEDLFSFPRINSDYTFPDGETEARQTNSCKIGSPPFDWEHADLTWTPYSDGEIGCVFVCCWREPPFPESVMWFYRSLRPREDLNEEIKVFKAQKSWDKYQWVNLDIHQFMYLLLQIGVHIRRSDNLEAWRRLLPTLSDPELRGVNTSSLDSALPLQNYVDLMERLRHDWPNHSLGVYNSVKPVRFFLATDNNAVRQYVSGKFQADLVVFFENAVPSERAREEVRGLQLAVIDLFLLSLCKVVIGTPFSTFSEAASYIGGNLLLEPDFEDNLLRNR